MTPLQTFIAHLVTLGVVVGAACALAVEGIIDGATALTIIGAATGISFGSVVTSTGANVAAAAIASTVPVPATSSTTTTTTTPAVKVVPAPTDSLSSITPS